MRKKCILKILTKTVLFYLVIGFELKAEAQVNIKPDLSLPKNTTIKIEANKFTIEDGTQRGNNLFHSFQSFSLSTGQTALFNNASDIANIIVRVTGGSRSNIDGMIKASGTANLFFLNPNGIVFGKNAQLNLGGSFFGTTATALIFGNGVEYSATKPQAPPLLAINIPIGLRFNENPSAIEVQGTGQRVSTTGNGSSPITKNSNTTSLSVQPSKTLTLVGGDVLLEGGNLTAEQGSIILGSVGSGTAGIKLNSQGWALNYEGVSDFKDINLSQEVLVDASGDKGGSITIQGKNLSLSDGSGILIQNRNSSSGNINIKASELINISGSSPSRRLASFLRTESLGSGDGGDVNISTKNLVLQGGGNLGVKNYDTGRGGNVNIFASDSIELLGFSSFSRFLLSSIFNISNSSGQGGNIALTTRNLLAKDGGFITSFSKGKGNGGNIDIDANSIQLLNSDELIKSGTNLVDYVGSYIGANTSGTGNAGVLTINAASLFVGKEASVNTTTTGAGAAGSLNVNVPIIKIDIGGNISSSVNVATPTQQQILDSPSAPTGTHGDVKIQTDSLDVTGGLISVKNQGTQDGGTLQIHAHSINLNNNSSISATTASGQGGNISLHSKDLQLRTHSSITATAGNRGDGGNITIDAGTLTGLEQSSITANAFEGRGGNIKIVTQGLFLSPDSQITATSEKGVNGTVDFITPGIDLLKSVALIPPAVNTPKPGNICDSEQSLTTLVKTGTGGTPFNVSDSTASNTTWNQQSAASSIQPAQPPRYVEARGWVLNPDGKTVRFVADPNNPDSQESSKPNCH